MADKARFNPEMVDQFGANVIAACNIVTEAITSIKESGKALNETISGTDGEALNESVRDVDKLTVPIEEKFNLVKADVRKLFDNEQAALEITRKTQEEIKAKIADMRKKLAN